MKKPICLLCTVLLLLGLTGCGAPEADPEQVITRAVGDDEAVEEEKKDISAMAPYSFLFREETVIPGKRLPDAVAQEALCENQVATCVGAGTETVYQYDGFDITVHNSGSAEFVYSVFFLSDTVSTREGLAIGDSAEKVLEIYGEPGERGGLTWIYNDGKTDLIFLLSENTVVGIEYRMAD